MNTTTTRRGAIAAVAATIATGALAAGAHAKPLPTVWHQLQRRAHLLDGRRLFSSKAAPTRRELERRVADLTELVADLTDALVVEHTTTAPGVR